MTKPKPELGDNTPEIHRSFAEPWKPGESGNPRGRPKGSRNRLGEEFLRVLAADFEQHGQEVIETVRANKPEVYARIVADLLPKDINLNRDPLEDLSDEELLAKLEAVRRANGYGRLPDNDQKTDKEPGSVH